MRATLMASMMATRKRSKYLLAGYLRMLSHEIEGLFERRTIRVNVENIGGTRIFLDLHASLCGQVRSSHALGLAITAKNSMSTCEVTTNVPGSSRDPEAAVRVHERTKTYRRRIPGRWYRARRGYWRCS